MDVDTVLCDWCASSRILDVPATNRLTYQRDYTGRVGFMFGCDAHTEEHRQGFDTVEPIGGDQ